MRKKFSIIIFIPILVLFFIFYLTGRQAKSSNFFEIKSGQSLSQISKNLVDKGFLNNRYPFYIYVLIKGKSNSLKSGSYLFFPTDNFLNIANKIIKGDTYKIKITFPEGFTLKDIEKRLNELGFPLKIPFEGIFVRDFKKEFDFLKDAPDDATLEGYLFPDTYYFNLDMAERGIAEVFLKNFDKKFAPYQKEFFGAGLTSEYNKKIFDVITMASIVEKEVKTLEDKKLVSGIFWKRVELGIPLQSCATIAYILNIDKWIYSFEDTRTPSSYNTYLHTGLPTGPISNPGLESIQAALYPKENDYLYYLSTPEGKTVFSRTLEEHNIAKAKYLR